MGYRSGLRCARIREVVPFEWQIVFSDALRGMLFDQYREKFEAGDWVIRTDGDEFYQVPPPQFVKERLRPSETAVHLQWYYFRLTQQESQDYESGKVNIDEDRKCPIEDRRRYYKISSYAEPRMFRYRALMRWPNNATFPFNAGFISRHAFRFVIIRIETPARWRCGFAYGPQ